MTILNFDSKNINENKTDTKAAEKKEKSQNNENKGNNVSDTSASTTEKVEDYSNWGYDLYPERRGSPKPTFFQKYFWQGRQNLDKLKCEKHVYNCVKNNPLIHLMMAALNSSGCPFDIRRHISCESCDNSVTGGYDAELNQIVICHNTARSERKVQGVLAHEMVHMFDYCRNEMDFKNIEHIACTEIRAANLIHCSFLSATVQGQASPFHVKKAHQACVKNLAKASVMAVRKVTEPQARLVVEKVFPMCYNDLEPIGRRIRRNSEDIQKAYLEAPLYGYISDD
ncbi:hypothetical protein KPH14_005807 [Odynerus spinipes]|uniref:Mitochondrial inner membrane protease ATP23 n=1 Tax=Odynerus spinipes TaxID=1348599 RepID=A0AAD9RB93_9HYME|nr:hypothetical protein KPH14_005807 [Odynerus spinipes]